MAVIEITDLSKSFESVKAVDSLNLKIEGGSIFGFLGPNGAGKTTTIRLLLGLVRPTSGSAAVAGFNIEKQSPEIRNRCGVLLEHTGLYERLTAEDNLEFTGRIWHVPRPERKARNRELLETIGLWERREDTVGDWSRGMKQKLAVARALYHHPEIAFLDEPTAGLDPVAAAELQDGIQELVQQKGLTVFLNTHNLAEAEKLCDRIGVIRGGRLIAAGTPAELRSRSSGNRIEIGTRGNNTAEADELMTIDGVKAVKNDNGAIIVSAADGLTAAPLVKRLVERGVDILEVRQGSGSLHEAFLAMVKEEESDEEGREG